MREIALMWVGKIWTKCEIREEKTMEKQMGDTGRESEHKNVASSVYANESSN